jgi:ribonuclease/clavin/mitogillin
VKVITIRYKSTKYHFLETGKGLLAIDAGWPNTYREYKQSLKEQGCSVNDIRWVVVTHFHIDHAGLAGVLVEKGIDLAVFNHQLRQIQEMEALMEKKKMIYTKIDLGKITKLDTAGSRAWLKTLGIDGEALVTNAHSEDSISILLDNGTTFIGDLTPESAMADDDDKGKSNWRMLREKGAKYIMPAHAADYSLS